MADYKLQARIPEETAKKLFEVIKDLQEKTVGADVTASSITRTALEQFIEEHEKEKKNEYIKAKLSIKKLSSEQLEEIGKKLMKVSTEYDNNKDMAVIFAKLGLMFRLAHTDTLLKELDE